MKIDIYAKLVEIMGYENTYKLFCLLIYTSFSMISSLAIFLGTTVIRKKSDFVNKIWKVVVAILYIIICGFGVIVWIIATPT